MTYSSRRWVSTATRVSLPRVGTLMIATAMATFRMLLPNTATSPMPSRMLGKAKIVSNRRPIAPSSAPPAYPAARPSGTATTRATSADTNETVSEIRAPNRIRDRTSRPRSSVPNGCATDGAANGKPVAIFNGS